MPRAADQKSAAPSRSSVLQSMMNPPSWLLCMGLLPDVGFLEEVLAECRDDAEALTRRRLHHHPVAHRFNALGAEPFQPPDLGLDIVGLDVDVDAARVLDRLNLDVEAVVRARITGIARLPGLAAGARRHTESGAPEPGRRF